ncbi:MAG: hypothetical protein V4469_04535 [Patescibacteria group bacterium]
MNKEEIKKNAEQNGWVDLGPQKMGGLMSFTRKNLRMNVFSTTGTVVFQNTLRRYDPGSSYKDVTIEEFEKLCV